MDIKYAFEKQIDFLKNQREGIQLRPEIQILESTDSFAVSNASKYQLKCNTIFREMGSFANTGRCRENINI